MKILVAGASGLIGREVVRLLKEGGHFVRTLSRDPARARRLEEEVDEVRIADATEPGALEGVCDDIEVVVSALGAPVSPSAKGRRTFADVDLQANLALLDEARRGGARRFVYVGVYTDAIYAKTSYVASHTLVENAVKASGLEYGFVRPTGVFGALAEFVGMADKGRIPLIGDGSAESNPIHETDVAEAVVAAVGASSSTEADVGGPQMLTRRAIAELAFRAVGKKPRVVAVPVWMMRLAALLFGLLNRRMGDFLRFIIIASTHSCPAPAAGARELGSYFEAFAVRTRSAGTR